MESVYIHIPFCRSICSYCDFCKVLKNTQWIKDYLKSLNEEMIDNYDGELLKTIYIGGGTPSCLDEDELLELFEMIKIFKLQEEYEFTFECNIEDINNDLLAILKNGGVNRLSIGIESFNQAKLKFMGRNSNFKDAQSKINLCRQLGFNNINVDLIYGLPNESISDLKKDLKLILKLNPEHISTYSLILEDNTIAGINKTKLNCEDDLDMYNYIIKKLKRKKYFQYEISNFSLNGYQAKHNLTYWKNNEYYGFGLGAHGYISGFRYENTSSLTKYLKNDIRKSQNILSKQEMMENELMLGLRLTTGINIKEFYLKFNEHIQEVFDFNEVIKNKEIIYKNGYIYIPKDKLYLMNEILLKLL